MTTKKISNDWLRLLCCIAFALSLFGFGCGDSGSDGAGGSPTSDAGVIEGCFAIVPPTEEPDLVLPPFFAEDIVVPGTVIEADVRVDGETRTVIVDLADYWDLDDPPSGTEQRQTPGNQTLSFAFPTDTAPRGRYFFRITLCADDCALGRVLFTLAPDPDNPAVRSDYYQRVVFEGNTEVRSAATCLDADSIVMQ
jgi:hypothetical protein